MTTLLLYVIVIAIGGALALGGVIMSVIGIVLLSRASKAGQPHEPHYSEPVNAGDDGLAVPKDFEDAPQWLGDSLAGETAPQETDGSALVKDARRRGTAFLVAGVLLMVIGALLMYFPMSYLFGFPA